MGTFIGMIADFWKDIIALFDSHPLIIWDYEVSYTSLLFAILVVGFVISIYWKGAKA